MKYSKKQRANALKREKVAIKDNALMELFTKHFTLSPPPPPPPPPPVAQTPRHKKHCRCCGVPRCRMSAVKEVKEDPIQRALMLEMGQMAREEQMKSINWN